MNINARSRSKHSAAVILYAVIMAVLVIGIIVAWVCTAGRSRISLDEVYGNVTVERSGGQASVRQGMRLKSGDCVKALANSSARLSLGRDRYIYLEPDSTVTLTYSSADKAFGAELLSGAAAVRLDGSADISFSAPNVLVSASGAVFRVSCDAQSAEIICADGKALVSGSTSQTLNAGETMQLSGETISRSETNISSLSENALKSLMRIAANRKTSLSLNSLGSAYLALGNDVSDEMPQVTEAAETTVSEAAPETELTTASETEALSSETETDGTSQTTAQIWETSPPETSLSETEYSETTASTAVPEYETSFSETYPTTVTADETTVTASETTQITTPTLPWWEIINSAELTAAD